MTDNEGEIWREAGDGGDSDGVRQLVVVVAVVTVVVVVAVGVGGDNRVRK